MSTPSPFSVQLVSAAASVSDHLSRLPGVIAIAQGGSGATGVADAYSDIDLYVYVSGRIDRQDRERLIRDRAEPDSAYIDHRYFEGGDAWSDRPTGVDIDVIYRDCDWTRAALRQVLEGHAPSLGYSTALLFNVQMCRVLYDPSSWLGDLQHWANQPYPDQLATAILRYNRPLLDGLPFSYRNELMLCAQRGDVTGSVHVCDRFLASYFDILFAINRVTHPGEKRLLPIAKQLGRSPACLDEDVTRLVRQASSTAELTSSLATMDALIAEIDLLMSSRA